MKNYIRLVLIVSAVLIYFWFSKLKLKESLIYLCLAVIFYLSSDSNIFLAEASLIFLYGFPVGSLVTKNLIKKKEFFIIKEILIKYGVFLVVGVLLLFLF